MSVFASALILPKMEAVSDGSLGYTTMYADELFDQGLTGVSLSMQTRFSTTAAIIPTAFTWPYCVKLLFSSLWKVKTVENLR
jgi:hypothetical protein